MYELELSQELLAIILGTPGLGGRHDGLPFLLWGRPGMGKTSAIESTLSQLDWSFMVLSPQHDEISYGLVPVVDTDRKRVTCYPPDWVDRLAHAREGSHERGSCIVLDDLTSSSSTVQAAQLRLLTHRETASAQLPGTCRLVGIANPPKQGTNARPLDDATVNRLIHIKLKESPTDTAFLVSQKFRPTDSAPKLRALFEKLRRNWAAAFEAECDIWAGFLTAHTILETEDWRDDLEIKIVASARSVELAVRAVAAAKAIGAELLIPALLSGTVGRSAVASYTSFVTRRDVPSPEMVLSRHWPEDLIARREKVPGHIAFLVLNRLAQSVPEQNGGRSREFQRYWEVVKLCTAAGVTQDMAIPSTKWLVKQRDLNPPTDPAIQKILMEVLF